jgi:hypothetical protein
VLSFCQWFDRKSVGAPGAQAAGDGDGVDAALAQAQSPPISKPQAQ